jgi:hypothetical protein
VRNTAIEPASSVNALTAKPGSISGVLYGTLNASALAVAHVHRTNPTKISADLNSFFVMHKSFPVIQQS